MKTLAFLTSFLLLFLFSLMCFAQEKTDSLELFDKIYELSIEELMNLEVEVASMVVKDFNRQPVSVFSISRKQLELSGARTLSDALSMYVPGLFIVEDQDDVIIGFRGLAPDNNSKVMLLLNGQNLNIEWFWGPPPAILNSGHFDYIERVEVIRGPGSVTLGQGALLGVINIVTRKPNDAAKIKKLVSGAFKSSIGIDGFLNAQAEMVFSKKQTNGYVFFGASKYSGQTLREQGWAQDKDNEGFKGGKVIDIGTKLKRSANGMLVGNFQHKGFEINTLVVHHQQDLYNFYRDRNRFSEMMFSVAPSYVCALSSNVSLKISTDLILDDFSLSSVDGYVMGGTRENRYGAKAICNINQLVNGNRLAMGIEAKRYEFGRKNFSGNNFINNVVTANFINNQETFIESANLNKIWGYKTNLNVFSIFAEDYQLAGKYLDLFAGIRYDQHPFWGSNITPRVGAILFPYANFKVRLSYQTGFRGAVGLHYGGGFRQDGLLSEDNFNQIESSQIPVFNSNGDITGYQGNLSEVKPESLKGFEIGIDWKLSQSLNFNTVSFYNTITNVIDVGVISTSSSQFTMVNIGTDVPGDWNGYWFFKNTSGEIKQAGLESSLTFRNQVLTASISHSHVSIIHSALQQRGSMYITQKGNFKAYPEDVTRINFVRSIDKNISIGSSYLYYYRWFSPSDQRVMANHILNISINYNFSEKFKCTLNCTNLLNQKQLYPMNSNVGDIELSDGTPSLESTSYWLTASYKF